MELGLEPGWYKTATTAQWKSLSDVRRTYAHADGVRTRKGEMLTVFNIGGNKYRLVVRIRRWATIPEAEGRIPPVVLLPDAETVHNAFFDRGFVP